MCILGCWRGYHKSDEALFERQERLHCDGHLSAMFLSKVELYDGFLVAWHWIVVSSVKRLVKCYLMLALHKLLELDKNALFMCLCMWQSMGK